MNNQDVLKRETPSINNQACQNWFVYLLRCADNTLYCGITTNLIKRLRQHNGEIVGGAKYTKVRQPCELVYSEKSESRSEASKREYEIKQLSKKAKEQLINNK
ncbi:GIY-YIG nuclease family protein [Thiomicrorhabdus sp.]|uniref:GIY-YIG nuclease family protein n=1 Tax=Thiomicrorhabdus sp. TaxID=2039724 RepID=UPI002AA625D2|nr:GIY-YIG nuclease family protein [Thiomicrorhabdus sp.]